jgi:hypothetical protein
MSRILLRRVRIVVLIAGVCLLSANLGVTSAAAAPRVKEDSLAGVTLNWDKNLPTASRFTVLTEFGGAALRDNNTGVVWEQAPDPNNRTWADANSYCANKTVGGTAGWRLPSVVELKSVQDASLPPPFVPPIFNSIQSASHWSATTVAWDSTLAWHVYFHTAGLVDEDEKIHTSLSWCVRGNMNADKY